MQREHFNTLEELDSWLGKEGYHETKYFISPDYVKSIIGIADDGKLVYSYEAMVDELSEEYEKEPEIDDAYTSAIEWIDYNTLGLRPRISYILFDNSYEPYDDIFQTKGIDDFLEPYLTFILGMTQDDEIAFNTECMTQEQIDKIEKHFKEMEDEYKPIPLFI